MNIILEHKIRETFTHNLRGLRKSRNLSQARFAEAIDVEQKRVGAWEENRALPPVEKLIIIADYFQVDLRKILTESISHE